MYKKVPAVLSQEQIDYLLNQYKNLNNQVELNGESQNRHYPSGVGHFMISELTKDELGSDIWKSVSDSIFPLNCMLVYSRILSYWRTCFIPKHTDSYAGEWQAENDLSIIIQLSDPADCTGGILLVDNKVQNLNPGDLIMYTYNEEHEVKTIRNGTRYVLNLRCKMVK